MSDTIRSIRAEAHRIEVQVERFHPGYHKPVYVAKFVWDQQNKISTRTMQAIVKCTLA